MVPDKRGARLLDFARPARAAPLPPSRPVLAPGARLRQYELLRELEPGATGRIFLARDTRRGGRVVICVPPAGSEPTVQRFLLEARATVRCRHENILLFHEVGHGEGGLFLVREDVPGQSLRELLHRQRLSPERAVELMVPVVRALACAHAQGLVHRDLRPDHLLVTAEGTIKVLDFGLARLLQEGTVAPGPDSASGGLLDDDGRDLTSPAAPPEALAYRAPEQWSEAGLVDARTDLWAVGLLLFQMLTGRHPLSMLDGGELAATARLDEPMPRLHTHCPSAPEALAAVVDRCLLKHREQRFPDAHALLSALEPLLPASAHSSRAPELAALVHRLRERPLVTVVGPAGAGKSALVRTGLVPALAGAGSGWEALVLAPGRHPLVALAEQLEPLTDGARGDLVGRVERLRVEPGHAGAVLRDHAHARKCRLLLVVDPLEELYAPDIAAEERQAFLACLAGIADEPSSAVRVVLALRPELLGQVARDAPFPAGELTQGLFFLTAPSREGPHAVLGGRWRKPRHLLLAGALALGLLGAGTLLRGVHEVRRDAESQVALAQRTATVARDAERKAEDARARAHTDAEATRRRLTELQEEEERRRHEQHVREEAHQRVARVNEALLRERQELTALRTPRLERLRVTLAGVRRERRAVKVRAAQREALRAAEELEALLRQEDTRLQSWSGAAP